MNGFDEIGRLMTLHEQLCDRWARKRGINYHILAVLYGMTHYPDCTQKDICEYWGLPKQTVFSVCRQLAGRGWLRFVTDKNDKRSKNLCFTDEGRAFAEPVVADFKQVEAEIIAAFGGAEMAELLNRLQRLIDITAAKTQE